MKGEVFRSRWWGLCSVKCFGWGVHAAEVGPKSGEQERVKCEVVGLRWWGLQESQLLYEGVTRRLPYKGVTRRLPYKEVTYMRRRSGHSRVSRSAFTWFRE